MRNGKILPKEEANAIIKYLSNLAILGKGYELYEANAHKYPDQYKHNIPEVGDYIAANLETIVNNNDKIRQYLDVEQFTSITEPADQYLLNGVRNNNVTQLDNAIDLYVRAHSMYYYIGDTASRLAGGMGNVTFLVYDHWRVRNEPYERRINDAIGYMNASLETVLNDNSIFRGTFSDIIKGIGGSSATDPELSNGHNTLTASTRAYMFLIGEDQNSDSDSEKSRKFWIQSGDSADNGIWLKFRNINTDILNINDLDASTLYGARTAIEKSKKAGGIVSEIRSEIGAQQNRLEHTIDNQNNIVENTTAAESRIRDADMATEMMRFSKENILQQVGQAMLAQTNQSRQGILSLLQ